MIIDQSSVKPLYAQIYEQIKLDILNGIMKPGSRLKSGRALSFELNISRNTVELAYDHLFAEGFITRRPRQGYYVESPDMIPAQECRNPFCVNAVNSQDSTVVYNFRSGTRSASELPCYQWKKLLSKCLYEYQEEMDLPKPVFGELMLRGQIQKHLHTYRGVDCSTEQIVITTGKQFCLDLICRLLKTVSQKRLIAFEEPGYNPSRITIQNNDFKPAPITINSSGAALPAFTEKDILAAYITPSHQFPTGIIMSVSRRREFIQWAERENAYIIEDDSNCYFQYDCKPLPSLYALSPQKVFYLGSFSEALFPCVSVSYLVIPIALAEALHKLVDQHAPFVPFLSQKPLELFLKEGHWETYIRKDRKIQKEKCRALVNELKNKFQNHIHISGFQAGLHLVIQVKSPATEADLVRQAIEAGIMVFPASECYYLPLPKQPATVLLHYAGIGPADIPEAVERLYEAWFINLEP